MDHIDPLKVMRNPQTLAAYRDYQRQMRAAGQPWLTMALVAGVAEISVVGFALWRNELRDQVLFRSFLVLFFSSAVFLAVAALRMRRFQRAHPLQLP